MTAEQHALAGVRVLDFTWSVAGPTMTRYLASLGAEVIKLEWPANPDPMRTAMFLGDEQHKTLDNGAFFANLNVGKRSFTLNVRDPRGFGILCDLLPHCDVIAESFSASVFERWGLPYARLQELNKRIVYVSVSGFGHTGRHTNKNTWGPTAQAASGMTFMSGLPGYPPAGWGWSYLDVAGGYFGAIGVLTALYRQRTTGRGEHVDVSQVEAGVALNGATLLDFAVNGRRANRDGMPVGNRAIGPDGDASGYRGEAGAPYNAYPTRGGGDNDYCAVTVVSDRQWQCLKTALGDPPWADDPRLATASGRIAAQDEIDKHLAAWMARHDKYEAMEHLQRHGVPAAAVQSAGDRMERDPQLAHRGLFQRMDHPRMGSQLFEGMPFRMSRTDPGVQPRWPLLGQDNAYVLTELLGYSPEQVAALDADGVTWPAGMSRNPTVERSLW